jgi:DNA-binding MurR/RpiR family transcriptional regulator
MADDPDFDARLRAGYDTLSPQLQEAARWVIDNPAEVALLSTREQARRAGVTPATLTRLAQRLGMDGYEGVRRLYADAVRRRPDNYRGRAEELVARRSREGDAALVQDMFASVSQHLRDLAMPASVDVLAAAADRIAAAERVYCLGLRSSFSVAFIFHYIRTLFGSNSVLIDGPGATAIDVLRAVGHADVLLAISVQPYVRHTIEVAGFARARGAGIVAVTDSEVSPLVPIAHHAIMVRTETPSFFHTMTPAFAAVECLAALIAARRGEEAVAALQASEDQLSAFSTYLRPAGRGRRQS